MFNPFKCVFLKSPHCYIVVAWASNKDMSNSAYLVSQTGDFGYEA